MCRILRVLNRMGQFRKVVFNFLNGFLSDMALYNKFGLSLFGFAPGNHFQSESQKIGIVLFQADYLGLLRAYIQTETLFQPVLCCMEQLDRIRIAAGKYFEIICISDTGYFFQSASTQGRILITMIGAAIAVRRLLERILCWNVFPLACQPPVQFIQHNV